MADENFAIDSLMHIDSRREEGDEMAAYMRGDFLVPGMMRIERPWQDTNIGRVEANSIMKLTVDGNVLSFGGVPLLFSV